MKSRNWFWGIFFLLSAVFVIASQTGSFVQIGFVSVLATVLLAALLISSVVHRNYFGIFVPLAFLYVIYQQPLHLARISLWLLILAAVFASMGFSFLFHRHPKNHMYWHHGSGSIQPTTENIDDNNPYAKVHFGSSSKYLHGECLKGGQFDVSFGALELFFDQSQLSPDGAEIFLDCSFGAIQIYVPRSWKVIDKLNTSLGGVDNDIRLAHPEGNAPQLTLTGNVQFGGIEIHYI
ncbi:MAG: LiaF transmembrane domain-containing protein [bacterium]